MLEINKALFRKVFPRIYRAYCDHRGIFATHRAEGRGPQHLHYPTHVRLGSRKHLYWLTLTALSDRRTNSSILYQNFARMFEDHPKLFKRGYKPSQDEMRQLFRDYQIALPNKEIAFFITRKQHLDEVFQGNPLEIYRGATNATELMKKQRECAKERGIRNLFPGAKSKMFCLLAMFLREYHTLAFDDVVPVDVWVQSIAASTEIVYGVGKITNQTLERHLRPLLTKAFKAYRLEEGAANATWLLGKFGCTHCHRIDMERLCPVYDLCQGPFQRSRNPKSEKHRGVIERPLILKGKCAQRQLI